jgi:hypothetical protein
MNIELTVQDLSIAENLQNARRNAYCAINFTMVEAYWNVGRMIVEEEQKGSERAEYGAFLIKNLSFRLTEEFSKGFTETNLKYFRQFYLTFPAAGISEIRHTLRVESLSVPSGLRRELSWSHYHLPIRVEKEKARIYYMNEAANQNWSTRALERQSIPYTMSALSV